MHWVKTREKRLRRSLESKTGQTSKPQKISATLYPPHFLIARDSAFYLYPTQTRLPRPSKQKQCFKVSGAGSLAILGECPPPPFALQPCLENFPRAFSSSRPSSVLISSSSFSPPPLQPSFFLPSDSLTSYPSAPALGFTYSKKLLA